LKYHYHHRHHHHHHNGMTVKRTATVKMHSKDGKNKQLYKWISLLIDPEM
jgi:uncharacterized protein YjlB